jgi:hypothetical protein
MKIKILLMSIFIMLCFSSGFTAFRAGFYGNLETTFWEADRVGIVTNADWRSTDVKGYMELQLAGLNMEGWNIWSKLGANVDFYGMGMSGKILEPDFSPNYAEGINPGMLQGDANNFKIRQFEAHISKRVPLFKGHTTFAFFRTQNRTDIGQPYLRFFGDIGDGLTRSGIQWDSYGIAGFFTRGFIIDYRSDYLDQNAPDRHAYGFGMRVGRQIIRRTFLNLSMGITGGGNQYYKPAVDISDTFSEVTSVTNRYFYNVIGADMTINGDIPVVGSYYLFGTIGRSYAPEEYPFEYYPGINLLGNTNALVYQAEFKWNREFKTAKIDLGHLFFDTMIRGRQPRFQDYMGSDIENNFYQSWGISYNFPYKAISINFKNDYYHDYIFDQEKYFIWSAGDVLDESASLRYNLNLNILFRSGFSFNMAWDREVGQTYLGAFVPEGVDYLTFVAAGESPLGRISPEVKIVALGDEEKQLLSSAIEIFLNLSQVVKFYSRFAYIQSAGHWKSGDDVNWWDAFIQLQFHTGPNTRFNLELGDGGGTDNMSSDVDLINGASFRKRIFLKFEYWI